MRGASPPVAKGLPPVEVDVQRIALTVISLKIHSQSDVPQRVFNTISVGVAFENHLNFSSNSR